MGLDEGRRLLLGLFLRQAASDQFLHFALVKLVESHITVSHQVVSLDAGRFGRLPVKALLPSQHGLADVNTAVVHQSSLDDLVSPCLQQPGHAVSQKIVTDMP